MRLAGRVEAARDGIVTFAPDLPANLTAGDAYYASFIQAADAHVARDGLTLPEEPDAAECYSHAVDPIVALDLRAADVNTVIWATGYRYDFGWVDLDIFSPDGEPRHRRGVTGVPGAYFLGLPYLHKTNSSFLSGVGADAAWLADRIATG